MAKSGFFIWVLLFTAFAGHSFGQLPPRENGISAYSLTGVAEFEAVRKSKVYFIQRTTAPINLDGNPNEEVWQTADVGRDFYQTDPRSGDPATEETEFRVLYDDRNIYISIICHQDGPIIVSELARDFAPADGDIIAVTIDSFGDERNGFSFQTNPGGALRDQQINGAQRSQDWDGVWRAAARVQSPGWTAELEIPLKTLRFDPARPIQEWGINVQRIIRYKNEWVLWSPAPRPFGVFDMNWAGKLEGLEGLRQGSNLYIKPFAVANFRPDLTTGPLKKAEADAGLDLKYGVTSQLILDLTFNTDFSQVEADEQQVNLTRFSQFFPEKREFFLENSALFDIGASNQSMMGGGGPRGGGPGRRGGGGARDIIPFFSRKIGLSEDGELLPIRGGARLTGKALGMNIAAMSIQVGSQGEVPANNWTVVRLQKELLSNSDIGTFVFNRDSSIEGDWNRSAGLDANFRFLQRRLTFGGFAAKSQTPGPDDRNSAARFESTYQDTFYTYRSSYTTLEDNFNNDFGFIPRGGIRKVNGFFGVRPRPGSGPLREIFPQVESNYIMDQSNRLMTRTHRAGVNFNFVAGDFINITRNTTFERLDEPFVRSNIEVPIGDYTYNDWDVGFNTSRGRRVSVNGGHKRGGFWDGTISEIRAGAGWRQGIHFQAQVNWTRNKVSLPPGEFTTNLLNLRYDIAFSPRMFLNNFIQYNTDAKSVTSNIRFRFIHHPLSDFFIVYNEVRGIQGNAELNRAISVKMTHLFTF